LVIPDASYDLFCREFSKLTGGWPRKDGEIKGALLQAGQILALLKLAKRFELIYFFSGADMALITDGDTVAHRNEQAKRVTANLTPEHNPSLVRQVQEISQQLNEMSPQLYVQFILLTELVNTVIRTIPVYYSMTRPRELGSFTWTIDAKDKRLTEAEHLWKLLSGLILQSKFQKDPPYAIQGADQSDFDDAYLNDDQNWPDYIPPPRVRSASRGGNIVNLKKLMTEKLSFADSKGSIGLQVVDVLTNAIRRTMHGELPQELVGEMGKLLLAVPDGEWAPVVNLDTAGEGGPIEAAYGDVILSFQHAARAKFVKAFNRYFPERPSPDGE
jgi:hypothetical protein